MPATLLPVFALLALGALLPASALAQDYPTRTITLIVPFPPGGSTDAVARLARDGLSEALGQPIVIDNRGGAGGTTGAAFVANSSPDGYTLLSTTSAPLTMNKYMQKNYPYDPLTAFAPISLTAESYLLMAVHPSLPVRNIPEFIDYAKKNPGKLSFGSAGVGSAHHIAGELIKQKTGIDMVHVPYKGGGPAIQDLIAGNIPVSFGTAPALLPHMRAGLVRVIATTRAERAPDLPDIPTISETLPGVVTISWLGLFAPAGTPPAVVERINKAVARALSKPEVIEKFKLQGLTARTGTPAELGQRVRTEFEMWGKIIPLIGLAPQ
ncbi:MAG TPA: tripartite tricarboxylate transporter substrate binding protein [Xanthobacteraceae bacterium]